MTVNRLADRLRADPEVGSQGPPAQGAGRRLADVLKEIIADEQSRSSPPTATSPPAWTSAPSGSTPGPCSAKRTPASTCPSPSRPSTPADFGTHSYWRHRGKLDVPKERFISYPGASRDTDGLPPLRLGRLGPPGASRGPGHPIRGPRDQHGWPADRLTPLLAGLLELIPWLQQWRSEVDPAYGERPAEAYDAYLTAERESRNLPEETLRTWRPPQPQRGRRRSAG